MCFGGNHELFVPLTEGRPASPDYISTAPTAPDGHGFARPLPKAHTVDVLSKQLLAGSPALSEHGT